MGNRAIITLKNDPRAKGVYVHYQGGEGSVTAFVEETKRRIKGSIDPKKETDAELFYASFYGVYRDFAGYCMSVKNKQPVSVWMVAGEDEMGDTDNGTYFVEDDLSCPRFKHSQFDEKESADYKYITGFFNEWHHAACAVVDDEVYGLQTTVTAHGLKADIAAAEVAAKRAQSRVVRLKGLLSNLESEALADKS